MITAEVIKALNSSDLEYVSGALTAITTKVLPPSEATNDCLVFVSKMDQLQAAIQNQAPVIIAHKSLTLPTDSQITFFRTSSVPLAMAAILPLFDGKMIRFSQEQKIHPLSSVHSTAVIGKNVSIGAFAVIGEHVKIGDHCTIGSQTTIEAYAEVGEHSLLHPQVFIGAHCILGTHCEIHPHTTIGSDGFAFAPTRQGTHKKIPQIGNVVIGNHVEIGANCSIDRAALTTTRIGDGTKLDNLCHIAHNVVIGENCAIAAGFKVAGSSTIGNNFMVGGDTSVTHHVTITDGVIVGGRSGVTNDIKAPGAYGGFPLEPLKDSLRTMVNMTHLTQMRKDLARIMKQLGIKED